MSDAISTDPGLSVYFTVDVDGVDLGSWDTCSGLGIELESEDRTDSAVSVIMHHISGRIKYTNLVLGRPISSKTADVINWIISFSAAPLPTAAEVKALDSKGSTIVSWSLFGVRPVKWTGPSFDSSQLQLANEQLELSYQGFL